MLAGETITLLTEELKRQESENKEWPKDILWQTCEAANHADDTFGIAYAKKPEEDIKAAIIKTVACYLRILKGMK